MEKSSGDLEEVYQLRQRVSRDCERIREHVPGKFEENTAPLFGVIDETLPQIVTRSARSGREVSKRCENRNEDEL